MWSLELDGQAGGGEDSHRSGGLVSDLLPLALDDTDHADQSAATAVPAAAARRGVCPLRCTCRKAWSFLQAAGVTSQSLRVQRVQRPTWLRAWRQRGPAALAGSALGVLRRGPIGLLVMCRLLVLWDIDHTLTENHGVNKEIYAHAFELLTGQKAEYPARTDGRTEPEIMRDMLVKHGIDPIRVHAARMPEALEKATQSKAAALCERGHELPGARDALMALQASPGVVQSVLSGNIRPNAFMKLSTFNLDAYIDFEVGGYGSDDEVRANLVSFAQERASAKYAAGFDRANTVLIGDTIRDVQAGRNGGARVVAVASGSDSIEALWAEGADIVLPDLRHTQSVVDAVTGFASQDRLQN